MIALKIAFALGAAGLGVLALLVYACCGISGQCSAEERLADDARIGLPAGEQTP